MATRTGQMVRDTRRIGYLYIVASACLWATTGIFAKTLYAGGVTARQFAFLRTALAFLIIALALTLTRRDLFRVELRHLPLLAVLGLTNVAAFSFFYFYTIEASTITQAVFLMYTGPIFAVLLCWLFLNERLAWPKVLALVLSLGGIALMTSIYNPSELKMPAVAVATGLASAVSYGFSRLFGKMSLRHYSPWTATFYSIGFGLFFLFFPLGSVDFMFHISWRSWALLWTTALISGLGAFCCFFIGLKHVEASRASIVGTVEPVVASLLALAFFGEMLSPSGLVGAVLILLGAIMVQF